MPYWQPFSHRVKGISDNEEKLRQSWYQLEEEITDLQNLVSEFSHLVIGVCSLN